MRAENRRRRHSAGAGVPAPAPTPLPRVGSSPGRAASRFRNKLRMPIWCHVDELRDEIEWGRGGEVFDFEHNLRRAGQLQRRV